MVVALVGSLSPTTSKCFETNKFLAFYASLSPLSVSDKPTRPKKPNDFNGCRLVAVVVLRSLAAPTTAPASVGPEAGRYLIDTFP
jgi:hypothetical protein